MQRRALFVAGAVFSVTLMAGALAVSYVDRRDLADRRQGAGNLARASAFAIEREFERSFGAASTLAAMVAAGASQGQLDEVVSRLLDLSSGTVILQLAEGDVISRTWPLAGNESAIGLDLLHHPVHGSYSRTVSDTRRPLLYGPFELVQGGAAFAWRVPVVVGEGPGARPWGLASAIVRLPVLLEQSRITGLVDAGFDYELYREGAAGVPGALVASARLGERAFADPVNVSRRASWADVDARRRAAGGWSASTSPPVLHASAFLIALLAAALAYRTTSLPETLRREVAARTAELVVAHQEQRRAEEAQRHSQKLEAVGLLAGGIAHDFNNLLVGILGYADILAGEAASGSVNEEAARTISQAAHRAADLTRQLLAFARLGSHRQVPVDLHAVVDEVAALLARTFDKTIQVERRLSALQHHVLGDPGQLQQVVLNLAVNARDAMPAGGTLTLETAVADVGGEGAVPELRLGRGRHVVLSVKDTGVGIPRAHLERIFEPFFTTKEEGRGTGLGLATAYGIVNGHRGAIRVESEEGVGTCFTVYLPVVESSAEPCAPPATALPRGSGIVLVVDDEEIVRRTVDTMLRTLGFEPALASGGEEALAWLATQPAAPAAVILDLAMPGMDGRRCFREMRLRYPDLRVVISSGFTRNGGAEELLQEGAREFVQKPYVCAELANALARAVAGPRSLTGT